MEHHAKSMDGLIFWQYVAFLESASTPFQTTSKHNPPQPIRRLPGMSPKANVVKATGPAI